MACTLISGRLCGGQVGFQYDAANRRTGLTLVVRKNIATLKQLVR